MRSNGKFVNGAVILEPDNFVCVYMAALQRDQRIGLALERLGDKDLGVSPGV